MAAGVLAALAGCDLSLDGIYLSSCDGGSFPGANCPAAGGSSTHGSSSGSKSTTVGSSGTSGGSSSGSGATTTGSTSSGNSTSSSSSSGSSGTSGGSSSGGSSGTTLGGSSSGATSTIGSSSSGGSSSGGGSSGAAGPWAPSWLSVLAGGQAVDAGVDGTGALALVDGVSDVAADGAGHLYFTDSSNDTIRTLSLTTGLVTTLAGKPGVSGSADGTGTAARFDSPNWLTYDGAGHLYVSDYGNRTIRMVTTSTGTVKTVAGSGGSNCGIGTGTSAVFYQLGGLAYDGNGHLYVSDTGCFSILEFDTSSWSETLVSGSMDPNYPCQEADGPTSTALFSEVNSIAYDGNGHLYLADTGFSCSDAGNTIREIDLATKTVSTLAGTPGLAGSADGVGAAASFNGPTGIVYDGNGNLYISDSANDTLRELDIATQAVTTVAGSVGVTGSLDGIGLAALFDTPGGLSMDNFGHLFIADANNADIREYIPATGVVTTAGGSPDTSGSADSDQGTARFATAYGSAYDGAGTLYVSDNGDNTIRAVDITTGATTTIAGTSGQTGATDGIGAAARFNGPGCLTYDSSAGVLYVVDQQDSQVIRSINLSTFQVTTVVGTPGGGGCGSGGTGPTVEFNALGEIWADGNGHLYAADTFCFRIVELNTTTWAATTLAGSTSACAYADGPASQAAFSYAGSLTGDGLGNLYIIDSGSSFCSGSGDTVRKLDLSTMLVSTIAGTPGVLGSADGIGAAASFHYPGIVTYDGVGNLFIVDGDYTIRRLALANDAVTTVLGVAGQAGLVVGPVPDGFLQPTTLQFGPGPALFITDRLADDVLVAR